MVTPEILQKVKLYCKFEVNQAFFFFNYSVKHLRYLEEKYVDI